MKNDVEYCFDFRIPGRVEMRCRGQAYPAPEVDRAVRFFVNDSAIASEFSAIVDPLLADAIDVAVAAHMADRLALRERSLPTGNAPFNRKMRLRVAVRNPKVWASDIIQRNLTRTLEYLTQDLWEFEFTECATGRAADQQQFLFGKTVPELIDVGLFSGGLDSLAGTAAEFEKSGDRHFIGVSASPTNIHAARQRNQFLRLRSAFAQAGAHVSIQYSMMEGSRLSQERTRRTRGFAFLILGSVVARSTGAAHLYVYENGIGAINLPYDLSQLGIDNTRAMHPRNLRNVASLISTLTGVPFSIANRSIFLTKGQMCNHSAVKKVADVIANTFSCDGWTHSGAHCGYCTSCLLRRQSLESAGLAVRDTNQYLNDCTSDAWQPNRSRLRGLSAMTWQATRLQRCLRSSRPWHELISEFPELQIAANELALEHNEDLVRQSLINLYGKYVDEWFRFSGLRHLPMRLAA